MVGKNQSYVREINRKAVIKSLVGDTCSATILAEKLQLSNASLSAILNDLLQDGYITKIDEPTKKSNCGRPPVYYTFNGECACLMAILLSNYYVSIVISDMRMNVLDSATMKTTKYDLSMVCDLVQKAKEMLANEKYASIPLISINLAVPGRVNQITGELQLSPQFDESIFGASGGIVGLFKKQFGVPVTISNDIYLSGIGEMSSGLLKDVDNGLLIHVDEGIGGAFVLNGKMYGGDHGFSGEVGLMRSDFMGKNDSLDEFVSIRVLKAYFSEKLGKKMHTADVIELYKTDEEARRYINETAKCLGKKIKDIVELLDISQIVLSGRAVEFGQEYLDVINKEVSESINGAKVAYSQLGKAAIVNGTLFKAVKKFTAEIV